MNSQISPLYCLLRLFCKLISQVISELQGRDLQFEEIVGRSVLDAHIQGGMVSFRASKNNRLQQ